MAKIWHKSKSIWWQIVSGLLLLSSLFAPLLPEMRALGLDHDLSLKLGAAFVLIDKVGGVYLRTITKDPVRLK